MKPSRTSQTPSMGSSSSTPAPAWFGPETCPECGERPTTGQNKGCAKCRQLVQREYRHRKDTPVEVAETIQDRRQEIWRATWRIYDLSRYLVNMVSDRDELKQVCSDVLGTSHQNVERWAKRAEEMTDDERDELYAPRTHKTWHKKGWIG